MNIITIDLGTTVCKVRSYDVNGRVMREYSEEISTRHPQPDWAEQDPGGWWEVILRGFRQCADGETAAIGICSHRESILAVDKEGRVILPCILWADRRCDAEARELDGNFGRDIHQETGMKPDPYFSAPKILWVKRNRPGLMAKIRKFLLPKDYLVFRLTGKYSTDWSVASRTMMFSLRKREWWGEMLDYLGIEENRVCDPVDSDTVVGDVTGSVRTQLGLPKGVVVVAGAGDRQCEALGAGVSPSTAMESTGSATNLSISASSLPGNLSEGLLYSCHAVSGQYLLEQGIGSTGLALRWFRDTFRPPGCEREFSKNPYGVIDREASRSVPGSNGLTFLPFLMGAQATRWNPGAKGVFFGIRLGHGYGDMARAVLEGIAFEIRAAIGVLVEENLDPGTILALGGSAGSETWNRIKADAIGRIYSKPRVTSAASLGAMILGVNGCGLESPPPCDLNPVESRFAPDPETRDAYDRAYRTYERLYRACEDVFRG